MAYKYKYMISIACACVCACVCVCVCVCMCTGSNRLSCSSQNCKTVSFATQVLWQCNLSDYDFHLIIGRCCSEAGNSLSVHIHYFLQRLFYTTIYCSHRSGQTTCYRINRLLSFGIAMRQRNCVNEKQIASGNR